MMSQMILDSIDKSLVFDAMSLNFEVGKFTNLFAEKNNKTVEQTLSSRRYAKFETFIRADYASYLDMPLGQFLLQLKSQGDARYRDFLNDYGDGVYCRFAIGERLDEKGLYLYVLGGVVHYVGMTIDTFKKRINSGYGRISPKNCYIDGQSTNCHLNGLICQHRDLVQFYVCTMTDDDVARHEAYVIQNVNPLWNKALKRRK